MTVLFASQRCDLCHAPLSDHQAFTAHCPEGHWGWAKTKFTTLTVATAVQVTGLVAQIDDPELLEWLAKADELGGDFVASIAHAALVADHDNYPLIRPLLLVLRQKYTTYEPSDLIKQEIRDRRKQGA